LLFFKIPAFWTKPDVPEGLSEKIPHRFIPAGTGEHRTIGGNGKESIKGGTALIALPPGNRVIGTEGCGAVPEKGKPQKAGFFHQSVHDRADFFIGYKKPVGHGAGNGGDKEVHRKTLDAKACKKGRHSRDSWEVFPVDGRIGLGGNSRLLQSRDTPKGFGKGTLPPHEAVMQGCIGAFYGDLSAAEAFSFQGPGPLLGDQGSIGNKVSDKPAGCRMGYEVL
jgi:hypothetical protein